MLTIPCIVPPRPASHIKPLRGCLYEKTGLDKKQDGTIFVPLLKAVYIRNGTG